MSSWSRTTTPDWPAIRKASAVQNNPIVAGMGGMPISRSWMPNVKRGNGEIGSMPTVESSTPNAIPMMPLRRESLASAMVTASANTVREKYSGPENMIATLASGRESVTRKTQLMIPPRVEDIADTPSARPPSPFFVSG